MDLCSQVLRKCNSQGDCVMVLGEHSGTVSGQGASDLSAPGEISGDSLKVDRPLGAAVLRTRARIRDLDRATCRTRLSQRRFLIQLQSESGGDVRGELQRYRESMINSQWSGRVLDWD
jgi:hypothetical protein